eukprot:2526169-Rhodomonas_salina.1
MERRNVKHVSKENHNISHQPKPTQYSNQAVFANQVIRALSEPKGGKTPRKGSFKHVRGDTTPFNLTKALQQFRNRTGEIHYYYMKYSKQLQKLADENKLPVYHVKALIENGLWKWKAEDNVKYEYR